MASAVSRRKFRSMLSPGAALLLPGVANALTARIVADQGFAAAYVTGAGIANTFLGVPDIGLVTVTEVAEHVAAIRAVFPGPLVVDADTGFGNPLNMVRTVELLERAGADALQIEDQVFPKRCGHFAGKQVIPAAEMVEKVKAAVDTRRDRDLLIIARTDAIAPEGYDAAIERAAAYHEAGADVTFVEAPTSMEQIADIPRRLPWPQLANIVLGGRTPELPNQKLKELGYAGVIYANVALQAAVKGMQAALGELRRRGHMGDATDMVADFSERQRLVHKDDY
ncbi:MAG: isocitrate lyase/PEP mutase family protein, partial [Xanthobacteraceae bacterium]